MSDDAEDRPEPRHRFRFADTLLPLVGLTALAPALGRMGFRVADTVTYRYPLEWMEGGTLDVARRLADGDSFYTTPSFEYVPYLYAPLYYELVGVLYQLGAESLPALRAVSVIATLASAGLLYRWAREFCRPGHAIFAPALFLALFELTGRWFHIARTDMVALGWLLLAAYGLKAGTRPIAAVLTGVAIALAVFTKQSSLLALAPLLAYPALAGRRRLGLIAGAAAALTAGALAAAYASTSDGWFLYFVVALPSAHRYDFGGAATYLASHLLSLVPLLALGLLAGRRKPRNERVYLALAASGFLLQAFVGLAHTGGFDNVLLPGAAVLSLLGALGLGNPPNPQDGESIARSSTRRWGQTLRYGPLGLVVVQGALLFALAPPMATPRDPTQFEQFLDDAAPVFHPDLRGVAEGAGLGMAARDVLRAPPADPGRTILEGSLRRELEARPYRAVLLSQEIYFPEGLVPHYCPVGPIAFAPEPIIGAAFAPRYLWLPRTAPELTTRAGSFRCREGL
ncbi:MAG: hypothetical protein AAGF12_18925 [Myxococcota bacterium]